MKTKTELLLKTIGSYATTCVVWLESSVCLKRKLGVFVGNSCMICMLQTFCDLTFMQTSYIFFQDKRNGEDFLSELDRKEYLKEIHALKQLFGWFNYELKASV